jgi:hypothetical protein
MNNKSKKNKAEETEDKVIYTMSITTKNGRKIYRANGKPFRIVIKAGKKAA